MITYVNTGPAKSGSTSFYNLFSNNGYINCGKIKEPIDTNIQVIDNVYIKLNFKSYIDNWDYDSTKDNILLDSSAQLSSIDNIIEFKKYLSDYIDDFKFIFLIRDPYLYYRTRLFSNFLYKNGYYRTISVNDILTLVDSMFDDSRYIQAISHLSTLNRVLPFFDKGKIFILPIEHFSDYKKELSKFLNIGFSIPDLPHKNITQIKTNKQEFLDIYIRYRIQNSEQINSQIRSDFRTIDSEYGSMLYNLYIRD